MKGSHDWLPARWWQRNAHRCHTCEGYTLVAANNAGIWLWTAPCGVGKDGWVVQLCHCWGALCREVGVHSEHHYTIVPCKSANISGSGVAPEQIRGLANANQAPCCWFQYMLLCKMWHCITWKFTMFVTKWVDLPHWKAREKGRGWWSRRQRSRRNCNIIKSTTHQLSFTN